MKPIVYKVIVTSGLIAGFSLWFLSAKNLNNRGEFDYTPNVATLKGSPYGKIVALAVQGPIDLYWHEGQTHADAHVHSPGEDMEHDHSDDDDESKVASEENLVWHVRGKNFIGKMGAFSRRKTNGRRLSKAHIHYLQTVTENKLKFAYELDSTNYVNYGNYHYFLSMSDVGNASGDIDRAFALAGDTLELCQNDSYDPSSWVTATMASYDRLFYMSIRIDDYSVSDLEAALIVFDDSMSGYKRLMSDLQMSQRFISVAREKELALQMRLYSKLRESYGIYVARLSDKDKPNLIDK